MDFSTFGASRRIGVGITKPDTDLSPYDLLDKLLSDRPGPMSGLGKVVPLEVHAGNVPIEKVPTKITAPGLIVVGDAACQANPIVGEGIRLSMRFGKLAAEAAADALQKGDYGESAFAEYEREAKKIQKYNSIALTIQRRMAAYTEADWEDAIGKLQSFSPEEFLSFLRAEFSSKNLLRTIARHPILLAGTTMQMIREMIA